VKTRALWQVIEDDDYESAAAMLRTGARVDARGPSGLTPLMIAAGHGNLRMVELLLDHAADALCVDARAGVSVLHKACQGGSLDVVRLLVEKGGAFVDLPAATTGHTPLMDALWYKWPGIVEYLLSKGAGLGLSTHYGFTLQQHVDYERSVNFFDKERFGQADRMVLEDRRRRNSRAQGQVLMAAVAAGDLETVRTLLQRPDVRVNERFPIVNGFNDDHTPLHVACRDGHTDIAKLLLDAGADVNAVEPVFGAVPLHKAVYNGHARITGVLADRPGINLDFQGATNGYTPLHDALWHGFADCALILIRKGARLDLRGHDGKRPLDLARDVFGPADELMRALQPNHAAGRQEA
jgi:ankyrin repeat protein